MGVKAKLSEEQIVPIMVFHLHPKMAEFFTAVKPKSYSEFYSIAQTAETNYKRSQNRNFETNSNKPRAKPEVDRPKKKPPNPCRICEGLGYKNRYHWANECRNKGKNQNQTKEKSVNLTESNGQAQGENDLMQINLNE